jgi:hypothetical protein
MKRVLKMKVTKNIALSLVAAALFAVALPGQAANAGKIVLNHCGCDSDENATGLVWTQVNVNKNSCNKPTGHNGHGDGDVVSCNTGTTAEPVLQDFIRGFADSAVLNVEACSIGMAVNAGALDGGCEQ